MRKIILHSVWSSIFVIVIMVSLSLLPLVAGAPTHVDMDKVVKKPKHENRLPSAPINFKFDDGYLIWSAGPSRNDKILQCKILQWQIFRGMSPDKTEPYVNITYPGETYGGTVFVYKDWYVMYGHWEWYNWTFVPLYYYYQIRAVNKFGYSDFAYAFGAIGANGYHPPFEYAPNEPRNLTAISGVHKTTLTWDAPLIWNVSDELSNAADYYWIYRGTDAASLTWTCRANGLSFIDFNVTDGVTYYYQVVGLNSICSGYRSVIVDATPTGT